MERVFKMLKSYSKSTDGKDVNAAGFLQQKFKNIFPSFSSNLCKDWLSHLTIHVQQPAPLTDCWPGNRAYYYAKLAVSSTAVVQTHYAYSQREGQAEWARVNTKMVRLHKVTHPIVTSLM